MSLKLTGGEVDSERTHGHAMALAGDDADGDAFLRMSCLDAEAEADASGRGPGNESLPAERGSLLGLVLLIRRRHHLLFGGKIDPELEALRVRLARLVNRHLGMHDWARQCNEKTMSDETRRETQDVGLTASAGNHPSQDSERRSAACGRPRRRLATHHCRSPVSAKSRDTLVRMDREWATRQLTERARVPHRVFMHRLAGKHVGNGCLPTVRVWRQETWSASASRKDGSPAARREPRTIGETALGAFELVEHQERRQITEESARAGQRMRDSG